METAIWGDNLKGRPVKRDGGILTEEEQAAALAQPIVQGADLLLPEGDFTRCGEADDDQQGGAHLLFENLIGVAPALRLVAADAEPLVEGLRPLWPGMVARTVGAIGGVAGALEQQPGSTETGERGCQQASEQDGDQSSSAHGRDSGGRRSAAAASAV